MFRFVSNEIHCVTFQVDRDNRRTPFPEKWEPLLNNLGHVCRKLNKLDDALKYHRRALAVRPKTASTYASLGYISAWRGEYWSAASYLHQALALRRDDTVSSQLLNHVVEALAQSDDEPFIRGPVGPDGPDAQCREIETAMAPDKGELAKTIRSDQDCFKRYALALNTCSNAISDHRGFSAEVEKCSRK